MILIAQCNVSVSVLVFVTIVSCEAKKYVHTQHAICDKRVCYVFPSSTAIK